MKQITLSLYSFEELSEEAKQKAIEDHRDLCNGDQPAWADENRESMEKFSEIFPIKVTNWSYGGRGEGVDFRFETEDYIEELSGVRLATYIWNNYKNKLFKGKWYSKAWDEKLRILNPSKGTGVERRSKIILDNCCVLTGYCMDDTILDPIYQFLNKPSNIDFRELLEDCFDAWIKACNSDIEWQNSYEYLSEELINNEYEFEEDGSKF